MANKNFCRLLEENLVLIAENDLEGEVFSKVRDHLDRCARCSLLAREFIALWRSLSGEEELFFSESAFSSLMKKVHDFEHNPSIRKTLSSPWFRYLRPAAVALLFVAGVLAGWELGKVPPKATATYTLIVTRLTETMKDIQKSSAADFYINRRFLENEKLK